jgi:hypothetical protein
MRFAILVKTTESSEAGEMPNEEILAEVVAYHEELARAGALYDGHWVPPDEGGVAHPVLPRDANRSERTVRGGERADRRLHDHRRRVA